MLEMRNPTSLRTLPLLVVACLVSLPAQAKYSGGSGTAQDPYRIAIEADLVLLGESPGDYGKHFILTTDIDLDPNLPGRKVFDKAVIAPEVDPVRLDYQGTCFTGVFDGQGHAISHLTIKGQDGLGLFGCLASGAEVKNLGVVGVNITGSAASVGGLVADNGGSVTQCYSTGAVSGTGWGFGGLLGSNGGAVTRCYSTSAVSGGVYVGGIAPGLGKAARPVSRESRCAHVLRGLPQVVAMPRDPLRIPL